VTGQYLAATPRTTLWGYLPGESDSPVLTIDPGEFGGNLDIALLGRGSVLYLPVQVPGRGTHCSPDSEFSRTVLTSGDLPVFRVEGAWMRWQAGVTPPGSDGPGREPTRVRAPRSRRRSAGEPERTGAGTYLPRGLRLLCLDRAAWRGKPSNVGPPSRSGTEPAPSRPGQPNGMALGAL
jgi:hypothetical protein